VSNRGKCKTQEGKIRILQHLYLLDLFSKYKSYAEVIPHLRRNSTSAVKDQQLRTLADTKAFLLLGIHY
jgi:hypothetical protein